MSATPKVDFDKSYDWVSSHTHNYRPRQDNLEDQRAIVESILKQDAKFIKLTKQCRSRWLICARLGKDTLHLALFDMDELKRPGRVELARLMDHDQAIRLTVGPGGRTYGLPTHEEYEALMTARPFIYAVRSLTPMEAIMAQTVEVMEIYSQMMVDPV